MSIFKKKLKSNNASSTEAEHVNPYLNARREWNDHIGSVVSSRQTWQIIGILSLLIALAGVGGMIHIGGKSKFIPYVIEVDSLGQTQASGAIQATTNVDKRVIHSTVTEFIINSRTITPDVAMQRRGILKVYALLSPNDPSTLKMNEWLNGSPEKNPFNRATKEMVNIEITSAIPQSPDTWQIDWKETTRDGKGAVIGQPDLRRALVTVYTAAPNHSTTDEDIRNNPLGVYIRDFSWSRLNSAQ